VQSQQDRSIAQHPIWVERGQGPCNHATNGVGQVLLVDDVLRADLAGRQPSRADPAADRLRIAADASGGLWHSQGHRSLRLGELWRVNLL